MPFIKECKMSPLPLKDLGFYREGHNLKEKKEEDEEDKAKFERKIDKLKKNENE